MNRSNIPLKMLYRAHPWHGVSLGEKAPEVVNCYVEMVATDTIKYELDKTTGLLKIDRPQKYSSLCPTLYGLLPQTYSGERTAKFSEKLTGKKDIEGDQDPLDICVLTENMIVRGDFILEVIPIGGFRLLDHNQADDKIIAVMLGDAAYGKMKDISECPESLLERLRHYFLTYKSPPHGQNKIEITHDYGHKEAFEVIQLAHQDYLDFLDEKIQRL